MRLAWFTPLPPSRSGVATYSAELLPSLAARHEIEVFVEAAPDDADAPAHVAAIARSDAPTHVAAVARSDGPARVAAVSSAHDFVWKHARRPYEQIVYQLGNATCHDYLWPYLTRYRGVVVMHDAQLHHARARALLQQRRAADYRDELKFDHPDAPPDIAELGVQGLLGSLTYWWPMLRVPIRAATLVAVHSEWLARRLRDQYPGTAIETVRMGVPDPRTTNVSRVAHRDKTRARLGVAADAVVFAAFGGVTPEKRIPQIIQAFAAVADDLPGCRLLLVGAEATHYDARADAASRGVSAHVIFTGFVDDAELAGLIAAADICLCLRWPSGGETSASWLRCLAAGKPTVITDLAHHGGVPTLVTRGTWTPSHLGALSDGATTRPEPVAVSIDLLDEDRSLAIAMRRLARDPGGCRRLGQAARAHWEQHHRVEQMVDDYEHVLTLAKRHTPRPTGELPTHLAVDGAEHARALLEPFGEEPDILVDEGS